MPLALMQILLFEQARYCTCASKCSWFPSRADLSQGDSDGRAQRGTRTMQLTGIHHLTAVTGDAPRNLDFFTRTLGMRLVKKTVNQDDTSAYHLFYADGEA